MDFKLVSLILILGICIFSSCEEKEKCVEKINPDCICTMQYDPVCGCNNKTYGNSCMAICSGIEEFTNGECN